MEREKATDNAPDAEAVPGEAALVETNPFALDAVGFDNWVDAWARGYEHDIQPSPEPLTHWG